MKESNWQTKKLLFYTIILSTIIGCATPNYKIIHCMDKPEPAPLRCQIECNFNTSDPDIASYDVLEDASLPPTVKKKKMPSINYECSLCADDLANILLYYKYMNDYSADNCLSIEELR
jgi:hypothetical protein